MRKRIKFKCFRVYAKVVYLHSHDRWDFMGEAVTEEELYPVIRKVRDDFHDTYDDLDLYCDVRKVDADGIEWDSDILPSEILRRYGGEAEDKINARIERCQKCYYFTDRSFRLCRDIGKPCGRYIHIDEGAVLAQYGQLDSGGEEGGKPSDGIYIPHSK